MTGRLARLFGAAVFATSFCAKGAAQSFLAIHNTAQELYISANGLTVAGNQGLNQQGPSGWLWDTDTRDFWSSTVSNTYVLSGNGLAAGGDTSDNGVTFYYPYGGSPYQPGIVPQAMSTDGQTLYGYDNSGNPDFVWTPQTGGTVIFSSNGQYPWSCSGDGAWLYGYSADSNFDEAWVWTASTGLKDLGTFHPYACSLDGQTVVGVDSESGHSNILYLWNTKSGAKRVVLPGDTYSGADMPISITDDGSLAWGTYEDAQKETHAFFWDGNSVTDLGENTAFLNERGQLGSKRFPGTWEDSKGVTHYGFYELEKGWVDVQAALAAHGHSLTGWSAMKVEAISDSGVKMCGNGNDSTQSNSAFYVGFPADYLYLADVILSESSVIGGHSATLTVEISGTAGTDGAEVYLESSSPKVTVPAMVKIPAGESKVSLSVSTSKVSAQTPATITASYDRMALQARITVGPPPPSASPSR